VGHELHDRASLETARRIAAGLQSHPEWIELARANLERWSRQNHDAPTLLRSYAEWRHWLAHPVAEIAAILTAETDDGQRLRQNSPFVGILNSQEVRAIKSRLRTHATTAA